jgi:Na+/H+ antiporter NhaC
MTMKKIRLVSALFLTAMGFMSYGQETSGKQSATFETKVIAVVNRANWCGVCKANGERFSNNIMPYTTKGVAIVMNDMTNDSTIVKSKADLEKSSLYKQIYKSNRRGVGRMMQVCGIIHGKNKTMASGIVTFIDAKALKVLSETSIAITDAEMKKIIDNLLKI